MDNTLEYQLKQNGKSYFLSVEIYNDLLRIIVKDNFLTYIGEYSLIDLKKLSPCFNCVSIIKEAQNIINQSFQEKRIHIEQQENAINLILLDEFKNKDAIFTLRPRNISPEPNSFPFSPINSKRTTNFISEGNYFSSSNPNYTRGILSLNPKLNKNNMMILQSPVEINNSFNNPNNPCYYIPVYSFPNSPVNNNNNNLLNQKIYELQNLQNELNKTKDDNGKLKHEKKELMDHIQQLNNRIHQLNEENINLRNNYNNEMHEKDQLEQKIKDLLNEVKILNNIKNDLEQNKMAKENEINSYKSQIENLLQKINELQNENNFLKIENQKLLQASNMAQSQNQFLTNQNLFLESQLNQEKQLIKGELLESEEELEFLTKKIGKMKIMKIAMNLIYKATINSDKAQVFHEKCDNANNTIVIVKSGNGKRFGGFTSCNWRGNAIQKQDMNAFVFSLDKMQIYDIIPGKNAIDCYPYYGPIFSGCQIQINDDAFTKGGVTCEKRCNYNTNEDYELTGGHRQFDIKEIEVYEVELN